MSAKKKKTYLAIVGILSLAFFVDRLWLSGSATAPQTASAGPPDADLGLTGPEELTKLPIPGVPFPKNIPKFGTDFVLRDVFLKPGKTGGPTRNPSLDGRSTGDAVREHDHSRKEFASSHTITAVFSDDGLGIAVVDGEWLRVGQSISGCRLIGVDGAEARFQCHDGELTMEISDAISGL